MTTPPKKIYCARGFYYHMVLPSSLAVYPLFAQIRKRTCDTEGIFILYWCQGFCLARISNIYVLNHP